METHAESPKREVLETHSFDIAGALAFNVSPSQSPLCRLCPHRALPAQGDPQEFTRCLRTDLPWQTGCKRISKFTLLGSAGDGSKFTNNRSVRCINCFHAKKSWLQAGEDDADQGARFMPAHALYRMHCPAINFDEAFLRQRVVETYISML